MHNSQLWARGAGVLQHRAEHDEAEHEVEQQQRLRIEVEADEIDVGHEVTHGRNGVGKPEWLA